MIPDNDIIKAIECCAGGELSECIGNECPFYEPFEDCVMAMAIEVLELINRRDAEIERLEEYNKKLLTRNTLLLNEIFDIKELTEGEQK